MAEGRDQVRSRYNRTPVSVRDSVDKHNSIHVPLRASFGLLSAFGFNRRAEAGSGDFNIRRDDATFYI